MILKKLTKAAKEKVKAKAKPKTKAKPKAKATKKKASKKSANPILVAQKALGIPETGEYDWTTMNKLQKFQIMNNLPVTGEADNATLAALGK